MLSVSELPSNSSGEITSSGEEFKWDSHSASGKVARTCGIHTISGKMLFRFGFLKFKHRNQMSPRHVKLDTSHIGSESCVDLERQ